MFEIGFGSRVITPGKIENGVSLVGIRKDEVRWARRKLDDLYVRVAWFRGRGELVIINGDLLCFPPDVCRDAKQWMSEKWGIEGRLVMMCATHTHSSPHMGWMSDGGEETPGYKSFLLERLKEAIIQAFEDIRPGRLFFGITGSGLCINRRKRVWPLRRRWSLFLKRVIVNRPNIKGPVDDKLRVLRIDREGQDITFIISMGCHPSLINRDVISADFPGRIQPALETLVGAPVRMLFLQGFGGDVRPNVLTERRLIWADPKGWLIEKVEGRSFEKNASEEKLSQIGRRLAEAIVGIPAERYREIQEEIRVIESEVKLPLRNSFQGEDQTIPMTIKRVCLGKGLSLISMPGEVFSEYVASIRRILFPDEVMPVGCSDGMLGYLPTEKAVEEGGYECERAYRLYGYPGPFSRGIEDAILEGLARLKQQRDC